MTFTYFGLIYIVKLQNCSSLDGKVIATKMTKCLLSLKVLSLLHVPPSQKKIYIPLSLVHLIYTTGDNCMCQNAKLQNCSSLDGKVIATKMTKCLLSLKVLSLLYVPPSQKKIYIPLSLVHLIYTAGDNCMRQNACFL